MITYTAILVHLTNALHHYTNHEVSYNRTLDIPFRTVTSRPTRIISRQTTHIALVNTETRSVLAIATTLVTVSGDLLTWASNCFRKPSSLRLQLRPLADYEMERGSGA